LVFKVNMKVLGPLFSKTAAGTPKDFATFSYRRTGQQARIQKKQVDSNTISQQTLGMLSESK